jgi:rhodanese-related sulfurtransferase
MRTHLAIAVLLMGLFTACASPTPAPQAVEPNGEATTLFATFTTKTTEHGQYFQIDPATLDTGLNSKSFLFVNVHIPYDGEIRETDKFIQYDQISLHFDELPADKSAPIVLYCRSGRMSTIAATTLADAGYTNVWELGGGMIAWEAAGYELLSK